MSWREILVFADGSEDGLARLRLGKAVADAHQAHLDVTMLVPIPIGAVLLSEQEREAARSANAKALAALREIAVGEPDHVSVQMLEIDAGASRAIAAREARTADLVIFGQPEKFDNSDLDTDIFIGALMESGRPCLMFPRWINPHDWGKRALIVWKGNPEAARAVQAALPLLKAAKEVRLCLANPRSEREGEDERGMARVATYLMRHGVKVDEPVIRESWEGSERMIVSEVEGFRADLVVMGGYEGSRLTEDLIGGVTATMVRDAKIPILFAH